MKNVKSIHHMISELHSKKHKKEELHQSEKIKHVIEKEIHDAHDRHSKAVRNYVIFFSFALLLLTAIYVYNPILPKYVIFLNIVVALMVFGIGVYLIHSLYRKEINDYVSIEKHIEKLKR